MTTRAAAKAAQYEDHVERVLKVALGLALSGYGEAVVGMTGMARAFRSDETLWNVHKSFKGPQGRTLLMHAASVGDAFCWSGAQTLMWASSGATPP